MQQDLPRSAEQQIGAAHDVSDALRGIVDNYGELVRENSVLTFNYYIAKLRRAEATVSLYYIVKKHHDIGGYLKTRRSGDSRACWSIAACSRITGVIVVRPLAARATTLEGMTRRLELFQGCDVYVVTLALIYDITVPVQAEAFQSAENSVCATGYNTGRVEVLDADQPATTVVSRIEIASDGSQKRAQM